MANIFGMPRVFGYAFGAQASTPTPLQLYEQYVIANVAPLLWLRQQETTGNPVNSGTLSGLTITQTACTQGEAGAFGTDDEAYDFDGAASSGSIVSIANNATLKALTTFRVAFLVHPDSLGASSAGKLFCWGNVGGSDHVMTLVSSNRLQMIVNATTTNGVATSNVNQISDLIGAWGWIFGDYDDADALGNGRKVRLFKGVNGVVSQLTLATDQALVGDVDQPSTALNFGNRTARDSTFEGQMDEDIYTSGLWTAEVMQQITDFFS